MMNGGLDVRVVDLVFPNSSQELSVHLPEDADSESIFSIPFTYRQYSDTEFANGGYQLRRLESESTPDLLKVTAERMHSLLVKVQP